MPIIKRSIDVNGRKTSVTLEDEFWEALRTIAHRKKITLVAIVDQIHQTRNKSNLSSAIRVFVLKRSAMAVDQEKQKPILSKRCSIGEPFALGCGDRFTCANFSFSLSFSSACFV